MNARRHFAVLLVAALACGSCSPPAPPPLAPGEAPNILLIVADDLGWGDLGSYGAEDASTPNLDRVAAQGVRATDFYVASPICSTSRASLLTGRSPRRHGLQWAIVGKDAPEALDADEVLLSDLLTERGYATGFVGKWHLGRQPEQRPHRRGFDEFFGMLEASSDYFSHSYRGRPDLWRGDDPVDHDGKTYATDWLTGEAIDFIAARKERPWFLCLSYNAPHLADDRLSLPSPERWRVAVRDVDDPRRKEYLAVVAALDDGVGRVLDAVDRLALRDDTLVLFLSDNGPALKGGSAGPLSGGKDTLAEGGIRVPFLARWPGHLPESSVFSEPLSAMDLVPTVLEAAGVSPPDGLVLDGRDILEALAKGASSPHENLVWDHTSKFMAPDGTNVHTQAVRAGRWKLVRGHGGDLKLFDLPADPGETADVAAAHPDVVAELEEALRTALASRR